MQCLIRDLGIGTMLIFFLVDTLLQFITGLKKMADSRKFHRIHCTYIYRNLLVKKKGMGDIQKFRERKGAWKIKDMKDMIYLSKKLIKEYPESAFLDELFYYLHHFTFVENWESKNPEMKREINEIREERRELLNLIKENIKKYKGRTQREALWAIIHGEMALGTSVEEIKSFVINSGVPLDREIKDYFGIDDEESQD